MGSGGSPAASLAEPPASELSAAELASLARPLGLEGLRAPLPSGFLASLSPLLDVEESSAGLSQELSGLRPPLPEGFLASLSPLLDVEESSAGLSRELSGLRSPLPEGFLASLSPLLDAEESSAEAALPALGPALRAAPQSPRARALFAQELSERLGQLSVSSAQLLREARKEALSARRGSWPAFMAGIWRQVDQEDRLIAQRPLEDQAIAQLRREVDGELRAVAPRFEGRFVDELERTLWRDAQGGSGARLRAWWARWRAEARARGAWVGAGLALAAAVAVATVVTDLPSAPVTPLTVATSQTVLMGPPRPPPSEVAVEQVTIEGGAVTVMPGDGVTLILVSEASS